MIHNKMANDRSDGTGIQRSPSYLPNKNSSYLDETTLSECSSVLGGTMNDENSTAELRSHCRKSPEPPDALKPGCTYRTRKVRHPVVNFKQRRLQANERERKRMQNLKEAFDILREHLPGWANEKHMSKYDVLILARSYIAALQSVLEKKQC